MSAGSYTVGFSALQSVSNNSKPQATLQVTVDGRVVGQVTPFSSSSWQQYQSLSFSVTTGTHTIGFQGLPINSQTPTVLLDNVLLSLVPTAAASAIVAEGSITITAQTVNLNGLVQSGRANRSVTLTQAMVPSGAAPSSSSSAPNLSSDTLTSVIVDSGIDQAINVWWDVNTNQFVVDNVSVKPGFINIVGNLINTGNGQLQALSGYSSVTVNNQTPYTVVLNDIETGKTGNTAGQVLLTDNAKAAYYQIVQQTVGTAFENAYTSQSNSSPATDYTSVNGLGEVYIDSQTTYSTLGMPISLSYVNHAQLDSVVGGLIISNWSQLAFQPYLFQVVADGTSTTFYPVAKASTVTPSTVGLNSASLSWSFFDGYAPDSNSTLVMGISFWGINACGIYSVNNSSGLYQSQVGNDNQTTFTNIPQNMNWVLTTSVLLSASTPTSSLLTGSSLDKFPYQLSLSTQISPAVTTPTVTTYSADLAAGTQTATDNRQVWGNPVLPRFQTDSNQGQVYLDSSDHWTGDKLPTEMVYYANSVRGNFTPMLFSVSSNGVYTLVGTSASVTAKQLGTNIANLSWTLESTLSNSTNYCLGFTYNNSDSVTGIDTSN